MTRRPAHALKPGDLVTVPGHGRDPRRVFDAYPVGGRKFAVKFAGLLPTSYLGADDPVDCHN